MLDIETQRRVAHILYTRTSPAKAYGGCQEWKRGKSKGYGTFRVAGVRYAAHRVACLLTHGPAPEGKPHALHHCDNKACVRGDHLYWGNDADNMRDRRERGLATGGRASATHCVHGHEFSEENTYWEPSGRGRGCKTCRRENLRISRARRRVTQ